MSHPLNGTVRAVRCDCGKFGPPGQPCVSCGATMNGSPYRGHNPQEPPGAEAALQSFSDALDDAVEKLKAARDAELEAEDARDAARWKALLSEDCPQPGVYDGVRITVAYRDAWVQREIDGEERALRAAKVVRQAAVAHLDKLKSQASVAQTIAKSVAGQYIGQREPGW